MGWNLVQRSGTLVCNIWRLSLGTAVEYYQLLLDTDTEIIWGADGADRVDRVIMIVIGMRRRGRRELVQMKTKNIPKALLPRYG